MGDPFHYDQTEYREQVSRIARCVVSNDDALPTIAPRVDVETNSYHDDAITRAARGRVSKAYPRLHR